MKAQDFIFALEKEGLDSISLPVLFLGGEEYWINTGVAAIKQLLFSKQEEDFNLVTIEFKSMDETMLREGLSNPPFFDANRLVILRGLEEIKAAYESIILDSLQKTVPGVFVVITARQLDRRKKFIKEMMAMVATIECPSLKVYEAKSWVRQEAKKLGLNLSNQQVDLLLEMKGTSLMSLNNELVKLRIFMGEEKGPVSTGEWSSLLGEASETNIFEMIDGALEGSSGKAINLLERLLVAGEPELKILAMLGGEVRRLFMAWALLKEGRGEFIQKELVCHPYVAEKLRNKAQRLTYQQLRQAHHRIIQADQRIKTGVGDYRLELEMTLLDLGSIFNPTQKIALVDSSGLE